MRGKIFIFLLFQQHLAPADSGEKKIYVRHTQAAERVLCLERNEKLMVEKKEKKRKGRKEEKKFIERKKKKGKEGKKGLKVAIRQSLIGWVPYSRSCSGPVTTTRQEKRKEKSF